MIPFSIQSNPIILKTNNKLNISIINYYNQIDEELVTQQNNNSENLIN